MERIYLTTPIYYINAEPHLGHTYTTVVADTLKRYYQEQGVETFLLTGTDEHGDKIVQAAKENGMEPKAYADRISAIFRSTWDDCKNATAAWAANMRSSPGGVASSALRSSDIF